MSVRSGATATETPDRRLPAGTVTFLFTDIEGSTHLLQEMGRAYAELLADHDRLLTGAIERHRGVLFGHEGDALFAAFDEASDAIAAAIEGQRNLAAAVWPDGRTVRVRMGIHTGDAIVSGANYVGLPLHQVARIANAGHGGQIVVSDVTRALAAASLPDGVELRDLGEHRLKDLARSERLHQVVAPGLDQVFPALRTLSQRPNNLPVLLTSFVGRAEIEETRRLLRESRLLTLTGPGGTGKTRLALRLAAEVMDDFPDGTYFVPLDGVDDADLVPSVIAQVVGIEAGGAPPLERLVTGLESKRVLLVLDNFEQVVDAAPAVGTLLRKAAHVKAVVTSRILLRAYGEQEFPVPPLSLPPDGARTLSQIEGSEAVRLFVERAGAAQPSFRLTEDNAPVVADIVARLDGLPLAIELAAARVKLLTVELLRSRLDQRLALLTGGARDLPARQQTLRGAIDWSYDLLDEADRRLFDRFSVFAGRANLREIEAVCGPASELGRDVLDGVGSLVEKSLLRPVAGIDPDPRFLMLATIREYAQERLAARGEEPDLRTRHAATYLAIAEACAPSLIGPDAVTRLDGLDLDHDNLRAAVDWAVTTGDAETAYRFGAALWRFWQIRGHLTEARERLERILGVPGGAELAPSLRARTLGAAGSVGYWRSDREETSRYYQEALAEARRSGDKALIAEATYNAGFEPMTPDGAGHRYADGRDRFLEAVQLYREVGDERGLADATWAVAIAHFALGDRAAARRNFLESLEINRRIGQPFGEGWALHMLGLLDVIEGRPDDAEQSFRAAFEIFQRSRDVSAVVLLLQDFAVLARERGQLERHWTLAGASDRLATATGARLVSAIEDFTDLVQPNRPTGDPVAERAWDAGAALTPEAAVEYALSGDAGSAASPDPGRPDTAA